MLMPTSMHKRHSTTGPDRLGRGLLPEFAEVGGLGTIGLFGKPLERVF